MYGTVSRRTTSEKSFGAVAVCGFAAVVAVAGLVGYSTQPAALYSATVVRPVTQTALAPAQQYAAPVAAAASAPIYESSTESVLPTASVAVQAASTFAPLVLGAAALGALVAALFQKKSTANVYYTAPIAMAATAGERPVWFPGAKAPAHLTGEYPGDRGFDPLGFSKDAKTFERMRISEVFHGRLAMLGIVGCVLPELLLQKPTWFEVGDSVDFNRFLVIALQCVAPIEYWRGNGGFSWDGNDVPDRSYPGFDPLGLTTDDTKLKEIKNGRLAMVGMLGLEVQNHVTGQSPLANLASHLADPLHVNITTSLAMFSTTGQKTDRPLWFPGGYAPSYLDGKYPGDRGFDPAGLAADPKLYEKYRVAEVFHGRLAMLAIVGAVVPDYFGLAAWYEAPSKAGISVEQVAQVVAIAALPEIFRGTSKEKTYPGFDPLKLNSDYNKEAEIKNGRLAMIGMLGLEAQHHITGKSPVTNLLNHWDHPLNNNIAESLTHPWPVAMFAATGQKQGLWFPGAKPPAHLKGEFIGDRGFDPLGLAVDPTVFERMRISEVIHGRFAMLGVAGSLLPELLGKGAWFQAGEVVDGTKVALVAFAIAAPTEYWRGQGGFGWDKCTTCDSTYPGFDPLKLNSDRQKLAEIKNGRLAMAAIAGFGAQAAATGESPLANLAAHLADPFGTNITSTLAMFATTGQRGTWFPNVTPPSYLTGEFPGDRGFDPAGLSADPKIFARMRVSEVFHGRLAMLGIVGCVLPEVLGNGVWFEAGDKIDAGRATLAALQVIAPLEYWRGNGGFGWNGEAEGRDRSYPGFDPLGLTDDDTKVAEIKNGRLAMIGMLGLEVQNHVTHQGPVANVYAHLADPLGANFAANVIVPWSPVAMFATSGHKDGLWFPGAKPPAHLTGAAIGDRGFDPLGLGVDPTVFSRMQVSEIIHGRFAMLGVAGSLLPELLGKGAWFQAGDVVDGTKVALVALAIAAPTEYWRGQGGFGWDKGTGNRAYPGFDPLKLTNDRQKLAEIKNGRLAMAAIAGFGVQAAATGESPLANLAAHLADPIGTNITTTLAMF